MTTILKTHDIAFSYGTTPVLQGVTIEIHKGCVTGILGPNGAGKSTLVNVMSGALMPSDGCVFLKDKPLHSYSSSQRARCVASVTQESHIPFPFTALEIVLMGRAPYLPRFGFESRIDIEIAMDAMKATDCEHLTHRDIRSLSGGERRRVIVARALAQKPEVLLLDEPMSFLDIRHSTELARRLKELANTQGLAVCTVMHDINLAAAFCDKIVFLKDGKIAAEGTPKQVITTTNLYQAFGISVGVGFDEASQKPYCIPSLKHPLH
ncbi:MAG: ABC transporter ATP-binding protein [Pseudomonadota bacterium]